jgi:hypothetical protein
VKPHWWNATGLCGCGDISCDPKCTNRAKCLTMISTYIPVPHGADVCVFERKSCIYIFNVYALKMYIYIFIFNLSKGTDNER